MAPSRLAAVFVAALILRVDGTTFAQQSPALPSIDPQQARFEFALDGLDGPGSALAYNDRLGMLAVGTESGSIQLLDKDLLLGIRRGTRAPNVLQDRGAGVIALAWSDTGPLVSAGVDHKLVVWSMPEGKATPIAGRDQLIRALALSSDGKLLAAAGDDGAISLIDTSSAKILGNLAGHRDWVAALAFSPDGKSLASGGYDGQWIIWDVASRKSLRAIPAQAPPSKDKPASAASPVMAMAFSPDGKILVTGCTDGQIHLFQTSDGKYLRPLAGHGSAITALAFHPNGTLLASASRDRTIRLWEVNKGQMLKSLEGHTSWVQGAAFVAQGARLASVGADRSVRIWNLSAAK